MLDHSLLDICQKIILTILLSGIIGGERQFKAKPAGLRTHILVAVGSTLVVMTSFFIYANLVQTNNNIDPTRMITGIVTGIGFLCAGTIIKSGADVYGLTTSATLWLAACVGIAVGAGYYAASIIVTILIVVALTFARKLEYRLITAGRKNKT